MTPQRWQQDVDDAIRQSEISHAVRVLAHQTMQQRVYAGHCLNPECPDQRVLPGLHCRRLPCYRLYTTLTEAELDVLYDAADAGQQAQDMAAVVTAPVADDAIETVDLVTAVGMAIVAGMAGALAVVVLSAVGNAVGSRWG